MLSKFAGTFPGVQEASVPVRDHLTLRLASIDDLDARDVVGPSTLAAIRDLITVTP